MREGQRGVEVRLGGSAVADPARRDAGVALDGRGHAPAHRLDELRGGLPEMVKKPFSRSEYMTGNWRPLSGSRSLDMSWHIMVTSDTSRASRMLCWR